MNQKNLLNQQEYNYWYSKIYGYFYRRVNAQIDARELTNDTLTDFFLYDKEIKNSKALVFKIASNKLKNFIRNKSKKPFETDLEKIEIGYSTHYQERSLSLIECAKKELSSKQFEVVEMCVLCDFTSPRVSQELNISKVNVRQILFRSLKKLREKCRQIWLNLNDKFN